MNQRRHKIKFKDVEFFIRKENKKTFFTFDNKELLNVSVMFDLLIQEFNVLSDENFNSIEMGGYLSGDMLITYSYEKEDNNMFIVDKTDPELTGLVIVIYQGSKAIKQKDILNIIDNNLREFLLDYIIKKNDNSLYIKEVY